MRLLADHTTQGEMLWELLEAARGKDGVACRQMRDGTHLFMYPLSDCVILGVGRASEDAHEVRTELVLRRRTEDPARYGDWLPAQLLDRSWFLMRKFADAEKLDKDFLEHTGIDTARELLFL